jgi:hypothetical protein
MGCPRSTWPPLWPREFAALQLEERRRTRSKIQVRNRLTKKLVMFVWLVLVQWPAPLMYIKSGWTFCAKKTVGLVSKTLIGVDGQTWIFHKCSVKTYIYPPYSFWGSKQSPIEIMWKAKLFVSKRRELSCSPLFIQDCSDSFWLDL